MNYFNERYFVDKEKGIVVCKLEGVAFSLNEDISKYGWPWSETLEINNVVTGKAVCASGDVFNEEVGKKIAFRKAYAKLNERKVKTLRKFIKAMTKSHNELVATVDKMLNKYDAAIVRQADSIKNLAEN